MLGNMSLLLFSEMLGMEIVFKCSVRYYEPITIKCSVWCGKPFVI